MDPTKPKSFDISPPQAPATSRPIIVGHQPMMTDPMMRPNAPTAPAQTVQAPEPALTQHSAKVIAVTDEMRQDLAQAEQPTIPVEIPALSSLNNVAPPQPAAINKDAPTQEVPAAQTLVTSQPATTASIAPAPPAAIPTLTQEEPAPHHLPAVPVSHNHSGPGRKARGFLSWGIVALVLIVLTVYLLMDAGLISGGSNLPLRLFGQQ